MSQENLTATRMTLLSLKKQTQVAQRGHKLLKDKQDGLMQEFLQIIRKAKELRERANELLRDANASFLEAQAMMPKSFLQTALKTPGRTLSLEIKTKNVMSVRIPRFKMKAEGSPFSYGLLQTRGELDIAIKKFAQVFEVLVQVAEIEKSAENLAVEIEKTRRRVNALEHRLIPELQANLKVVQMKLTESDRSEKVQVMAIKNMLQQREEEELAAAA